MRFLGFPWGKLAWYTPDEGLMKAKHRTMLCLLPACPHPSRLAVTPSPKGKAWFVRAQTDRHAPSVSRRARALQTSLPCAKGGGMRSMPEGLLQSKGTTPQAPPGCFSVSLAKSSVFSRRRKTPRDAARLGQLTPCTGEPKTRTCFVETGVLDGPEAFPLGGRWCVSTG